MEGRFGAVGEQPVIPLLFRNYTIPGCSSVFCNTKPNSCGPGGTLENSPALQCWVSDGGRTKSRQGRTALPADDSAVPAGLVRLTAAHPALKCWAILSRPSGTARTVRRHGMTRRCAHPSAPWNCAVGSCKWYETKALRLGSRAVRLNTPAAAPVSLGPFPVSAVFCVSFPATVRRRKVGRIRTPQRWEGRREERATVQPRAIDLDGRSLIWPAQKVVAPQRLNRRH